MPQSYPEVDAILKAHGLSQSAIISILQEVRSTTATFPRTCWSTWPSVWEFQKPRSTA